MQITVEVTCFQPQLASAGQEKQEYLHIVSGDVKQSSRLGSYLEKLQIELPYDPAIQLRSMHPFKGNEVSMPSICQPS